MDFTHSLIDKPVDKYTILFASLFTTLLKPGENSADRQAHFSISQK